MNSKTTLLGQHECVIQSTSLSNALSSTDIHITASHGPQTSFLMTLIYTTASHLDFISSVCSFSKSHTSSSLLRPQPLSFQSPSFSHLTSAFITIWKGFLKAFLFTTISLVHILSVPFLTNTIKFSNPSVVPVMSPAESTQKAKLSFYKSTLLHITLSEESQTPRTTDCIISFI